MLRSLNEMRRYQVKARDGDLGAVEDFLFDDQAWKILYAVVNTKKWWPGRSVLVAPSAIGATEWLKKELHMDMTQEQIKQSAELKTHKPVSQQKEDKTGAIGGWPILGTQLMGTQPLLIGVPTAEVESPVAVDELEHGDPHLRSVKEMTGYHIEATDGSIGHVEDLVVDEQDWTIRYAVVDTRNWLAGRKVLVAPWMIQRIDGPSRSVFVELTRDQVKNSPEYDPDAPVNREYEEVYYDYYGRTVYG